MKVLSTKPFLLLAIAVLGYPSGVASQQDSVDITVIDRTDLVVTITPPGPLKGFRGDSIQFTAEAVDTVSGGVLDVEFFWSSTNPNVIEIDPVTGWATFNSRGSASIVVEVLRVVSLIFMSQDDLGSWVEVYNPQRQVRYAEYIVTPDSLRIPLGENRPICVYEENQLQEVKLAVPLDDMRPSEWGTDKDGNQVPGSDIVSITFDPMQSGCPPWDEAIFGPLPAGMRLAYQSIRPG